MTKTKRNQKISVDKVNKVLSVLENLEAKPKTELTLRETVAKVEFRLRGAMKMGYSFEDLSRLLSKQDIFISATTLKQYLKALDKGSSSRKRKRSSRASQVGSGSSRGSSDGVVGVKEKSNSSDDAEQELINGQVEQNQLGEKTLAERLNDGNYQDPYDDDDDLAAEFNLF